MAMKFQMEGAAADVALKGANVRKVHAAAEQALATAEEKRAKAAHEGHRAAQTMSATDLAGAEFARDTLMQAHELAQRFNAPPQQQGQPQPGAHP
jgi:hypothetical protein